MPTFVALLRAVNVGKRQMQMARLRQCLTDAGYADVQTYIQTGNVLLRTATRTASKVERNLEKLIEDEFGFPVTTLVRTPAELTAAVDAVEQLDIPVPGDPRHFVYFMPAAPPPELVEELHAWRSPGERVVVIGRELHYFSTVLFDKSRFDTSTVAKKLAPQMTSRNIRVTRTLAEKWGMS